jgi:hypothetical protein
MPGFFIYIYFDYALFDYLYIQLIFLTHFTIQFKTKNLNVTFSL